MTVEFIEIKISVINSQLEHLKFQLESLQKNKDMNKRIKSLQIHRINKMTKKFFYQKNELDYLKSEILAYV